MYQEHHSTSKSNSLSSTSVEEKKVNSNSAQPTKKAKQKCPHCGFASNKPSALFCAICEKSLTAEPSLNLVSNPSVKSTSQASERKSNRSGKRFLLPFAVGAGVILASSVFMVSTLNASPEAELRKAEDVIYFGGEPCGKALITEEVAQAIQKFNPRLKFAYYKGSSNDQIDDLIEGKLDIALSERSFLSRHYERGKKRGVELYGIPYGLDGVAFFTNKKNKIRPLTVTEVKGIFEGSITDWRQFAVDKNGNPQIIPLEKLKKGEEQTIITALMGGEKINPMGFYPKTLNPNTKFFEDRTVAKEFTKKTEYAFFYTSATLAVDELEEMNVVSIRKKDGTIVSPVLGEGLTNKEAIKTGEYPFRRQVMIIVNKDIYAPLSPNHKHNQVVRAFADFLLSEKGQRIVEEADFVAKRSTEKKKTFLPWL